MTRTKTLWHAPRRETRGLLQLVIALLAALFPVHRASAQVALGAGDDAVVLPRGVLRVGVGGTFTYASERFTTLGDGTPGSERVPLDFGLSLARLGGAQLDVVGASENILRGVTGAPELTLTLGGTRVTGNTLTTRTPFMLELGLGSRLAVSVMVPYVETRSVVAFRADAEGATAGINPALGDGATATQATARNEAVVAGLRSASAELQALVASCASNPASSPNCGAVNSNPAGASAAAAGAAQFATGLENVYGTTAVAGGPVVPLASTAPATAVANQLVSYRDAFGAFGVGGITADAPAAAQVPVTAPQLQALLGDPGVGLGLAPIADVNRYGIGDVEIGTKVLLFDSFGTDPRRAANLGGFGMRLNAGALFRVATGEPHDALNLADIGVGDGQNDIEARVAADLLFGRRAWGSIVARYGVQLPDDTEMLVPSGVGQTLVPANQLLPVRRDLGNYLELEVTPRYAINQYVTLSAQYQYRGKGADSYEGLFAVPAQTAPSPPVLDPGFLGFGTEAYEHRAGFGLMISTVSSYLAGRSRLPADVSYIHRRVFAGGGALGAATRQDEIMLRVYVSLFSRRQ